MLPDQADVLTEILCVCVCVELEKKKGGGGGGRVLRLLRATDVEKGSSFRLVEIQESTPCTQARATTA